MSRTRRHRPHWSDDAILTRDGWNRDGKITSEYEHLGPYAGEGRGRGTNYEQKLTRKKDKLRTRQMIRKGLFD